MHTHASNICLEAIIIDGILGVELVKAVVVEFSDVVVGEA